MRFPMLLMLSATFYCLLGCQSKVQNAPSATSSATTAQESSQDSATQTPVEPTLWTQFLVPTLKSIKEDWPKVEESLLAIEGVREVRHKPTLDDSDDRVPDNVVLVKHLTDFNARQVIEKLKELGFEGASIKSF